MIKRLAVIFCAVALAAFTACGGPKAADGAPSEMSKAVDDMMQSDGFNAVGSVTDSLKAGDTVSNDAAEPSNDVSIADAFADYSTALKNTAALKAFSFSAEQTYSQVLDTGTAELERTAVSAVSDGSDYIYSLVTTGKDSHNKRLSVSTDAGYASGSDRSLKTLNQYEDYANSANNSRLIGRENYTAPRLKRFTDEIVFAFSRTDIESVSSGTNSYTFTINSAKGTRIVGKMLSGLSLGESAPDVSVSYFTVTVALSEGRITRYACSVVCHTEENGAESTMRISSSFELDGFDPAKDDISAPDWAI